MAGNTSHRSNESFGRQFRIHFVQVRGSKDNENKTVMNEAFQAMVTKAELSPSWTQENSCLSVSQRSRSELFVFSSFEGQAFDHLRRLKCSIIGPALVLSCLNNEKPIPRIHNPLFSDCLDGAVVCCSSIQVSEREKLKERVVWMGGSWELSLSSECTVLVTTEVGSNKYKAAVKQKTISIVTPAWIHEAWRRSHFEVFKAVDDEEMFSKLKCPIFSGLVITVSGLRHDTKKTITKAVEDNGGKFAGSLKQGETTHLISDTTTSEKYKVALNWKSKWDVFTVSTNWIFDSVDQGYCLDETDYPTDKGDTAEGDGRRQQKCSTPSSTASANAGGTSFRFVDPNITGITPEVVNSTVMSNVTHGITASYVTNSYTTTMPLQEAVATAKTSIQNQSDAGDGSGPPPEVNASATLILNGGGGTPLSSSTDVLKRSRQMNVGETTPQPSSSAVNKPRETDYSVGQSASKLKRRRLVGAATESDVMSQYFSGDGDGQGQDPNQSFRPQFDLTEAYDYVEKAAGDTPKTKAKTVVEESPSVIIERQLITAAERTGAGTTYLNSPTVDEVRSNLAKQLQTVFGGRSSFKRHGSNSVFNNATNSEVSSPTASASALREGAAYSKHSSFLSQNTQEESVVVDWDDPKQRRERQKVGGSLLRHRNEPTQSVLGEVDTDDQDVAATEEPPPPPKEYFFQLTSLSQAERDQCVGIISKLGAALSESNSFDLKCTHLVTGTPTRNEKLLTAIASGIWVLHIDFLTASDAAGQFVDETDYEFGSRNTHRILIGLREEISKLMRACPHWRQKIQAAGGAKAYHGWKVFLIADRTKEDGLARILINGGAEVTKSPHEVKDGITHILYDPKKPQHTVIKNAIDRLRASGATCYNLDVIFAHLSDEGSTNHLYVI